jgi:hypothetical protein
MDLLEEIRRKTSVFTGTEHRPGIQAVLMHIEVAEKHFSNGRLGDDYFFSDVIYRTNQAFEGALKEAYKVLTGKNAESLTPHKIEKYFSDTKTLKERVLALFTNYRMEWRNKSTHDHRLSFSAQEAFLAIVTISAFINILLDQMAEKLAYEQERQEASKSAPNLKDAIQGYEQLSLLQQATKLLESFVQDMATSKAQDASNPATEYEFLGKLAGYLSVADPEIVVETDVPLHVGSKHFRLDLMLSKGPDKVIVELKRQTENFARRIREGEEQLFSYLAASGHKNGILFMLPTRPDGPMVVQNTTRTFGEKQQQIVKIYPSRSD